MIYDIRLAISYDYAGTAGAGRHLLRVLPRDHAGQRVLAGQVTIAPHPEERWDSVDFFGNLLVEFGFRTPHAGLELVMQARVDRTPLALGFDTSVPWGGLAGDLARCTDLGPTSPLHHLAASPMVTLQPATTDFAQRHVMRGSTTLRTVLAVGRALHDAMTFDPEATEVDTPLVDAFAARKGVCQDYAHILIACLRGLGVPAGYVSGFLRTTPPPGQPRLAGTDAMHAWVQVWVGGGLGWVEYDPTNDCLAAGDHVTVARGRDYADVAPITGVLRVSGGQRGRQAVDVTPMVA